MKPVLEKRKSGYKITGLALVILIGIMITMLAVEFRNMGTKTNGSMVLVDETLYYSNRSGGVYCYNKQNGYERIIKKSDSLFGYQDGKIYYTYGNHFYTYEIKSGSIEEVESFIEEIGFCYSEPADNNSQVNKILQDNEEIALDAPYAIYEGQVLYVLHNAYGGYISVYETENLVDGSIKVLEETETILEYSYTLWQALQYRLNS